MSNSSHAEATSLVHSKQAVRQTKPTANDSQNTRIEGEE